MKKIESVTSCLLVCLGGKKMMPCDNFKQASDLVRKFIESNDLMGASKFYSRKNAGVILHPTKGAIAYVSYNGKVWEGQETFTLGNKEITDLLANDI